jgi:hypothetical protein
MTPSKQKMKTEMLNLINEIKDDNNTPYFSIEWIKANILEDADYIKYTKRKNIIAKLLNNNE